MLIEAKIMSETTEDKRIVEKIKEKIKEKVYQTTQTFLTQRNEDWKDGLYYDETDKCWRATGNWRETHKQKPKGMPKKEWKELIRKEDRTEQKENGKEKDEGKGWRGICQKCYTSINEEEEAVFSGGLLYHRECAHELGIITQKTRFNGYDYGN